MPPQSETVEDATLRGGAYLAARYGLGVLISVGNMLIMTRWIGPHAYGLFVTAIGMVAFLATLARGGIDTYLVRREEVPDRHVYSVAATLIVSIALGLALAGGLVTPVLVQWFKSREFVLPYLVLLLTVPLTALTGVFIAALERKLDFGSVAGIELGGQVLGFLVSAALAWSRRGVWAPVAGQMVWQIYVLTAAGLSARLLVRPQIDRAQMREMLSYGVGLTASLRTWQLRTLVNPLIVGRFCGTEAVAFVALALRVAEALGTVRLAAGRMAIAALSRLQSQREQFRKTLEYALYLQVVSLGPLLAGFALCGPFLVRHVMGARWMPALAVYPFVAAGVLINSVYNLQASALFVMGRQWLVMRSYTAHVLLLGAGTVMLVPRMGITGYGWAELLACGAYIPLHSGLTPRAAISYRRLAPWVVAFLAILFVPV